jgi:hypothetical protein
MRAKLHFCESYIIINPETNRFHFIWKYLFFLAIQVEFLIVPWVCMEFYATGEESETVLLKYKQVLMALDFICCIDILKTFITSFKRDVDYEVVWYKIAYNYAIKGTFLTDLLGSISFIGFYNTAFGWFFTRLFRYARLGTFRR